jgi:hypothetical protein
MTERQKELIQALESLVHRRFNEETLNAELSEIFGEPVNVEEICQDVDYLMDYNLAWNSEQKGIAGFYDIYVLKCKPNYSGENTMYVTEVGYEFDSFINDQE